MPTRLRVAHHRAIAEIDARQWDTLSGGRATLSHAFLDALESTGCVGGTTGWQPDHLAVYDGDHLLAALPGYVKAHSYGEYVFDWAWAEALHRAGRPYYPKLLCAVPFTPVPGPRLLARDPASRERLLAHWIDHARSIGVSSAHLLFATDADLTTLRAAGLLLRSGVQFHWHNAGYRDFEDFLASLTRDKRRKIRQERRRIAEAGVTLERIAASAIDRRDIEFFFECYRNTYAVRGQRPYLNEGFFARLLERCPQSLMLVRAQRDGRDIACALNLCDATRLYGRWWGEAEHVPCLHFEVCYYQGIEYAIDHGLEAFEGGAQGEHKMARGFTPVGTASAHWLRDADLAEAVSRFLDREHAGIAEYVDELGERTPYREPAGNRNRPGDQ